MSLQHRIVTGTYIAKVPDRGDPDLHMDRVPLEGRATLTPVYTAPLVVGGEHVVVESVPAIITGGKLQYEMVHGDEIVLQDLALPVTTDERANQAWAWRISYDRLTAGEYGEEIALPDRRFPIETGDGPLDLSEVHGTWSGGSLITRGAPGPGIQSITVEDGQIVIRWDGGDPVAVDIPELGDFGDRLITAEDLIADQGARLSTVEATVDQIKRTNVSMGEGAPTGTAPEGWHHIDVATGDIYRMEA